MRGQSAQGDPAHRGTVQGDRPAATTIDGASESPPAELAPLEPGRGRGLSVPGRDAPILVSYVSEHSRLYGNESTRFFARVDVRAPIPGFTLRLRIPAGMQIEDYRAVDSMLLPSFEASAKPELVVDSRTLAPILSEPVRYVVWDVQEAQAPGAQHEFEVQVRVNRALQGDKVRSQAMLYVNAEAVDQEILEILVSDRAAYLNYLPALYAQDDFMNRFLMLFESFWRPIEQRIDDMHHYLDPQLTPARFLPWLASWFRLSVESQEWTEAKQRRLLSSIIWLYRKRGTKHALQEYLEILTGNPVEIFEHRAKDFRLGASARLGVGIALGSGNMPFTFGVRVRLDPYTRPEGLSEDEWQREKRRWEEARRKLIHELIAEEKPAHTSFTVEFEEAEPGESGAAEADDTPENIPTG